MKKKPAKTSAFTCLTESIFESVQNIDEEKGIIYGARVLGKVSKNGRVYSQRAMEQAVELYDHAPVNFDHPKDKYNKGAGDDRGVVEGVGWLESVQMKGDAIFADLHYLKTHPHSPMIVESAKRNPKRFGLSHNAEGSVVRSGGKNVVESIEKMHSVDIVQNPATNSSLFESEDVVKKTLKEFVAGIDAKHKLQPVLVKLLEDEAMLGGPMVGEAPMGDVPADADADGQIDAAFKAMINAVLDDESLDVKGKLSRIKDILKAQDKLMNPGSSSGSEAPKEEPAAESKDQKEDPMLKTLKERVETQGAKLAEIEKERDALQTEKACRGLLESKKREVNDFRLKAMAALPEADRAKLVESWPEKTEPKPKPKFSAPITEATTVDPEKVTDGKSLAEAVLSAY